MADWYLGPKRSPLRPGPRVIVGGQSFQAAATPAALLNALPHLVAATSAGKDPDGLAAQVEALLAMAQGFLHVNYPDLTPELLGENSSVAELRDLLIVAVQAASETPPMGAAAPAPTTFSHFQSQPHKTERGN